MTPHRGIEINYYCLNLYMEVQVWSFWLDLISSQCVFNSSYGETLRVPLLHLTACGEAAVCGSDVVMDWLPGCARTQMTLFC